MVKFVVKKKKLFDETADWLPSKNRQFRMKVKPGKEANPEAPRKTTDKEGLDRAYADDSDMYLDPAGTLHIAGTKGNFVQKEWIENYMTYGPHLIQMLGEDLGGETVKDIEKLFGADVNTRIMGMGRYKQLDDYMKKNSDKVKNFVAHSKAASVVDVWMKNHPEFKGHARLYSTPYEDIFAKERFKSWLDKSRVERRKTFEENKAWWEPQWFTDLGSDLEDRRQDVFEWLTGLDKVQTQEDRNILRITNRWDPATLLDNSVGMTFDDPDWVNHRNEGYGHYYGNTANHFAGFDGPNGDGFLGMDLKSTSPQQLTANAPKLDMSTQEAMMRGDPITQPGAPIT
jgi:hypothetical protein